MKFRRTLAGVGLAATALLDVSIATPVQAQASTTYIYPVYHNQVCNRQGHFGASYWNPWSPGSWYCYDLAIPASISISGGLDINGWCMSKYGGTHAELVSNDVWGWRCIRRTA
jgi:hypothetical protein